MSKTLEEVNLGEYSCSLDMNLACQTTYFSASMDLFPEVDGITGPSHMMGEDCYTVVIGQVATTDNCSITGNCFLESTVDFATDIGLDILATDFSFDNLIN